MTAPDASTRADDPAPPAARRGPLRLLLDVFSSVRLGIALLVALFVYSSIGSAGLVIPVEPNILAGSSWRHEMVRQWAPFEMTEFEWFHTPLFIGLSALLALNLAVTTVRRIPFRVVNLGVWMIHTGIILLLAGSVIYFGTKVEGDAPVFRRLVRITFPDGDGVDLPALQARSASIERADGVYTFSVAAIDPEWPLLTAGEEGGTAFSVSVRCDTPGRTFVRQLLAGHPELTEDIIPGRGRAVKLEEFGERLSDTRFEARLEPLPAEHFWIKDSFALASREIDDVGATGDWTQRLLHGMPRYNDWIRSEDEVWALSGTNAHEIAVRPLNVRSDAPAGGDALGGVRARITGYLRYAQMDDRIAPGGEVFNPTIEVRLRDPAGEFRTTRLAMAPPSERRGMAGLVAFRFASTEDELARVRASLSPTLTIDAGTEPIEVDLGDDDVVGGQPIVVGETGWSVLVREVVQDLEVSGLVASLAILEITGPGGESFTRWAFEDETLSRDLARPGAGDHGSSERRRPDGRLRTRFSAGAGAPIVVSAGPGVGEGAIVWISGMGAGLVEQPAAFGEPVRFGGGAEIIVDGFDMRSTMVSRPIIWPRSARDRNAAEALLFAMAQVELTDGDGWTERMWLPFHKYSLDHESLAAPGLGRYEPTAVRLPDGREIELMLTRERRPLPNPVILEDFTLTSHVGGFSGETLSIRDWSSDLRFLDGGEWGPVRAIATNEPVENAGLRYFQAFWDAPAQGSPGMSFTGVGIGNRRGVEIQLIGSALSVVGMMYAFYVKPIIKRRRRERVLRELQSR